MNVVAKIARQGTIVLCAMSLLANFAVTPVLAQHVITILGTQPLLGRLTSTEELQQRTIAQREDFETASQALGLTAAQTQILEQRIANRQLRYGVIPRNLEVMTGKEAGRIFLERDVIIPNNTYGWEIDIPDGQQIIAVFIPAACGNLSAIHRSAPPPPKCPRGMRGTSPNCYAPTCPHGMQGKPPNCYAPAPTCPPGMQGTPPNCASPTPSPAPAPPPTPVPAPSPEVTPPPPPRTHKASLLWIPLLVIGGFLIGHNNVPPPPPPSSCP